MTATWDSKSNASDCGRSGAFGAAVPQDLRCSLSCAVRGELDLRGGARGAADDDTDHRYALLHAGGGGRAVVCCLSAPEPAEAHLEGAAVLLGVLAAAGRGQRRAD